MEEHAQNKHLGAFVSRHMVSFGVTVTTDGDGDAGIRIDDRRRIIVSTGSVYLHAGRLWLITAGHIIESLDLLLQAGGAVENGQLYDGYHYNASHKDPIPFPIDPNEFVYRNDKPIGLDLAIGLLPMNTAALLQANNIVPFTEESCRKVPTDLTEFHMLGLPEHKMYGREVNGGIGINVTPQLVPIAHVPTPPQHLIVDFPMWYGRVPKNIEDIQGMSGGLILGVRRDDLGTKYWPVGVQTGWDTEERVAYAVPSASIPGVFDGLRRMYEEHSQ